MNRQEFVEQIIRDFTVKNYCDDEEYIKVMEKFCAKLIRKVVKQGEKIERLEEENEMLHSVVEGVCDECKQDAIFERKY